MCKLLKPSVEKPWLKFFSEEAREASMPKNTIYRHLRECSEGGHGYTALNYFGNMIGSCTFDFAILAIADFVSWHQMAEGLHTFRPLFCGV